MLPLPFVAHFETMETGNHLHEHVEALRNNKRHRNMTTQQQYLTANELAETLKVTPRTIYNLTKSGMPCFNAGVSPRRTHRSAPRYELAKVQAWLEERTQKGGDA